MQRNHIELLVIFLGMLGYLVYLTSNPGDRVTPPIETQVRSRAVQFENQIAEQPGIGLQRENAVSGISGPNQDEVPYEKTGNLVEIQGSGNTK